MHWTSYFAFLTWLNSLGAKLPQAAQYLQVIIEALGGLGSLFFPQKELRMSAASSVSEEEAALETEVMQKLQGTAPVPIDVSGGKRMLGAAAPVGAWDGTILRQIWAFIQAHPELIAFLMKFLKLV